jgi:tetratricopeptide (TPR) repeat protein
MERKPSLSKALALEPIEASIAGGDAARPMGEKASADAKAKRDLRMTTTDEFLAKAAKEYQVGNVDQALWRRAADQCSHDASLMVPTYLRCRATSLQLQNQKEQSSQIQARGASSTRGATHPKVEPDPREEIASTRFIGGRPRSGKPKLWHAAAIVVALASAVAFVYVLVSPPENESAKQPIASHVATSLSQPVPSAGGTNAASPAPTFAVTVKQLKSAGKWQLLVLNASEWTRREPDNAAAWNELSFGYARLGQFGDALDAATRAVQRSPDDAILWRNLGYLDLDVDRLPEAGIAFAKALALRPDDSDALCGAALVAQRQAQPKDAGTAVKRVKTDGSCPYTSDSGGTAATAAGSAAGKPASSVSPRT